VVSDVTARVDEAERDAFITLYSTAADTCGTGWWEVDDVAVVWSAHDDDPAYSCVMDLADAADPDMMLARLEHGARARGATVIGIDIPPPLAVWGTHDRLTALGYAPDYEECIWARPLTGDLTPAPLPDGVQLMRVDAAQRDVFARVLNVGYDLPAEHIRGHVFASTIGQSGWFHYLVHYAGEPGTASVLYVTGGVADLFVATTVPAFRGRGGQRIVIEQRLADAAAAGCDIATSQTGVENASPRNMRRRGFEPLYRRWIYGKRLR
jgi:hypothetical protein